MTFRANCNRYVQTGKQRLEESLEFYKTLTPTAELKRMMDELEHLIDVWIDDNDDNEPSRQYIQ